MDTKELNAKRLEEQIKFASPTFKKTEDAIAGPKKPKLKETYTARTYKGYQYFFYPERGQYWTLYENEDWLVDSEAKIKQIIEKEILPYFDKEEESGKMNNNPNSGKRVGRDKADEIIKLIEEYSQMLKK